jgi:hypothetical protein
MFPVQYDPVVFGISVPYSIHHLITGNTGYFIVVKVIIFVWMLIVGLMQAFCKTYHFDKKELILSQF